MSEESVDVGLRSGDTYSGVSEVGSGRGVPEGRFLVMMSREERIWKWD